METTYYGIQIRFIDGKSKVEVALTKNGKVIYTHAPIIVQDTDTIEIKTFEMAEMTEE